MNLGIGGDGMMRVTRGGHPGCWVIAAGLMCGMLGCASSEPVQGPPVSAPPVVFETIEVPPSVSLDDVRDERLQACRAAYVGAEYDRAIDLCAALAQEVTADRAARRGALQYLGRAYIATREQDQAREAVRDLLALEPPLIELDPDLEPFPLIQIYYDVRKDLQGGYGVERPDPGMQTLAVMGFTNSAITDFERYEPLEWGLSSMLVNYLNGATDLRVVERERLQWLLDELDLQKDPSRIDQETAVRAGKVMGASAMLMGSYAVVGNRMRIDARLVKVETSEVILGEQVEGRASQLFDLVEELSLKVTRAINVSLDETQVGVADETRSLDAILSYSEGLNLIEREDYRGAYEKFLEALTYDEGYTRARLKAASLAPLLASN